MKLIDRDKAIMKFRECLWSKPEVHPSLNLDDVDIILYGMPTEDIYTEQNVRDAFTEGYGAGKHDSTHWIPCSERMPDVGAILISDGNQVFIGAYYGNNTWSADGCDYDPILKDIAWMPLPKPYGGEQE